MLYVCKKGLGWVLPGSDHILKTGAGSEKITPGSAGANDPGHCRGIVNPSI